MTLTVRSYVLLACILLFSPSDAAQPFTCPIEQPNKARIIKTAPDLAGLVYAHRGNRCEGFMPFHTGTIASDPSNFDIIAFSRSATNSLPIATQSVRLKLNTHKLDPSQRVTIAVRSASRGTNYRMDAALADQFFVWSLSDVLRPAISRKIITFDNLGILGYQNVSNRHLFYPIDLLMEPESDGQALLNAHFSIVVRPRGPAWKRRYEICPSGQTCCDVITKPNEVAGTDGHDGAFEIRAPRFKSGTYCLRVAAAFRPQGTELSASSVTPKAETYYLRY